MDKISIINLTSLCNNMLSWADSLHLLFKLLPLSFPVENFNTQFACRFVLHTIFIYRFICQHFISTYTSTKFSTLVFYCITNHYLYNKHRTILYLLSLCYFLTGSNREIYFIFRLSVFCPSYKSPTSSTTTYTHITNQWRFTFFFAFLLMAIIHLNNESNVQPPSTLFTFKMVEEIFFSRWIKFTERQHCLLLSYYLCTINETFARLARRIFLKRNAVFDIFAT